MKVLSMSIDNIELLVGRTLLGALFVLAGAAKVLTPDPFIAHMTAHRIPSLLLPAVIALEIAGGMALVLGWRPSWTALAMASFCVITAVIFHFDFSDKAERTLFFKDLAIAGGLLILAARR
jgi:putative oxidoreductase